MVIATGWRVFSIKAKVWSLLFVNACVVSWTFLTMHIKFVDRMHFQSLDREKNQRRKTLEHRRATMDKQKKEAGIEEEEQKALLPPVRESWETVEDRRRLDALNKKLQEQ